MKIKWSHVYMAMAFAMVLPSLLFLIVGGLLENLIASVWLVMAMTFLIMSTMSKWEERGTTP